ncbi:MAG: DUF4276 family protein [Acidobacteriota bacterium]|nr:DUF4276 family protein [Acidobacteriota bacterium]
MVTEIRIYAEGGGDSAHTKQFLRQGFGTFLRELSSKARERRVRWRIVLCGSRSDALHAFRTAMSQHTEAFNVLLVDSESAVRSTPWGHLEGCGEWTGAHPPNDQCHFMAQAMEAWFIADAEVVKQFYGQGFRANALPQQADVEQIKKNDLEPCLRNATRNTTKGEYHKGKHAWQLLQRINPAKVRVSAQHCERLFTTLTEKIES